MHPGLTPLTPQLSEPHNAGPDYFIRAWDSSSKHSKAEVGIGKPQPWGVAPWHPYSDGWPLIPTFTEPQIALSHIATPGLRAVAAQSSLQPTKTHSLGVVLCEGQWRGLGPTSVLTPMVIRLIAPTCVHHLTSHPGTVLHTTSEGFNHSQKRGIVVLNWC